MDTGTLVVATLLKIAFVLVIIFTFAPVLIWAERRQSAMMQDRIGPVRAGIPIPAGLQPVFRTVLRMGWLFHSALAAVSAVVVLFALGRALYIAATGGDSPFGAPVEVIVGGEPRLITGTALFWWGIVLFVVNYGMAKALRYALDTFRGSITLLGLLHPLADAVKFLWKEDFVPPKADKFLHAVAPILTVVTAILTFAVIPFADTLYVDHASDVLLRLEDGLVCVANAAGSGCAPAVVAGDMVPMQVASLNVGILFVFAIAGTGVVGAAIAGYASDNKYSLLGGLRAAGQMVSYEVTLGLTLVGSFMIYGTLLLEDMVRWQQDYVWGVFVQPVAAVLYFAAAIAETKRIPFDVPEGESELVGGYFTEYSGMKFGMFFMGEFIEVIVLSALAATLFFGGYDLPFLESNGFMLEAFGSVYVAEVPHWGVIALQMLTFTLKVALLIWFQLMIRWTLPRFRYDQIMSVCWKYILPLSLLNILVTGIIILLVTQ